MDLREDFERQMAGKYSYRFYLNDENEKVYTSALTENAWQGWKSAAAYYGVQGNK